MVHTKETQVNCDSCGKFFGSNQNLKRHVNAIHEKLQPFKCDTCGLQFSLKANLSRHIRNIHKQDTNI